MLIFLFFSFFLLTAFASIFVSNPVLSVLFLVLVFVLGSAFIVSIGLDYLGVLLLLVYVGAISVLFLFVVMMLNVRQTELNQSLMRFWWLGLLVSGLFFFELILSASVNWNNNTSNMSNFFFFSSLYQNQSGFVNWYQASQETSNIEILGEYLFLYNWDFVVIAVLLLFIAVLGPVYLAGFSSSTTDPRLSYKEKGWTQITRMKSEYSFKS